MYTVYSLLGPSVVTVGVGAHIIQFHFVLCLPGVRLEEKKREKSGESKK